MAQRSIHGHRRVAAESIDQCAADARVRRITFMAGQDMVYGVKLAQAGAYISAHAIDSGATVPAYVAAEVAAVGGTALAAAQAIVAAAQAFHDGPGPAIEQARRTAKIALAAATTPDAVAEVLASALEALEGI